MPPIVYWNSKLSHTGIIGYKAFEGCNRKLHSSSLANLLNSQVYSNWTLWTLINDFKAATNYDQRFHVNDQAAELLDKTEFDTYLQHTHQARKLNPGQSRKVKQLCNKLTYYSQKRQFTSKKSGKYNMRVAFLTLTTPEGADPIAVCRAFNGFLDYLQRTANCVYVWKKELGEESGNLHFHVLINNFIPYYIIAWKWKRLLLAQQIQWSTAENGSDSNSHYRIELPRNKRQTAAYVAKYMSKAYDLPGEYGYISGHSSVLDSLKEITFIENDLPMDEVRAIMAKNKVIRTDHVSIICCDLLRVKAIAPEIGAIFEQQYIEFSEKITLPQKFHEV